MRKLVRWVIATVAVFVVSQSAFAQSATETINLTATVSDYCSIAGSATNTDSAAIPVANGTVNTSAITINVASVVCTKSANVTLASAAGGVTTATTAGGFQSVIEYNASAAYNGATASIDTTGTLTNTVTSTGAANGTLVVNITPQANTLPMVVASDYADTLTVTLAPQP